VTVHVLKTLPNYYDAIERGEKHFEVRRDDRGFQRGDELVLRKIELDSMGHPSIYCECVNGKYTEQRVRVLWILTGGQFGIEPGYVVMSIERIATPVSDTGGPSK
jgi:hypothetical protein